MTYSWNQLRPPGFASFTCSMEVVPSVESVNGIPAAFAAPAPAVSPSVCIRRVNPVGAMPNGICDVAPNTVAVVSTSATSRSTSGWNSTSRNAWRARWIEISASAEPSV